MSINYKSLVGVVRVSFLFFVLIFFSESEGGQVVFPGDEKTLKELTAPIDSTPSSTSNSPSSSLSPFVDSPIAEVTSPPSANHGVNVTSPLSVINVSTVLQLKVPPPNVLDYNLIVSLGADCHPRDTCKGSSNGGRSRLLPSHREHNCFCDQICSIYDDCCIDSPFKGKFKKDDQSSNSQKLAWTCTETGIGSFYFKSTCPSNVDYISEQSRANCEADAPESDPMRSIPVTSGSFTYKNAFCAQCNGIPSHEWSYWNTRLLIVNSTNDNEATTSSNETEKITTTQIIQQLANMSQRFIIENLIFVEEHKKWSLDLPELLPDPIYFEFAASPPEFVASTLRPCYQKLVDSCPSDYHNQWIINACANYQATVFEDKDANHPGYRNVHCALCNGRNTFSDLICRPRKGKKGNEFYKVTDQIGRTPEASIPSRSPGILPSVSSFSILFDISATQENQINTNHEVSTVGKSTPCNSKYEMYDPFRKKCRNLLCGVPDAQVINGSCVPIHPTTVSTPVLTTTTTTPAPTTITSSTSTSIETISSGSAVNTTFDTNTTFVSSNVTMSEIIELTTELNEDKKSGSVGNSSLPITRTNDNVTIGDTSQTTSPPKLGLTQSPVGSGQLNSEIPVATTTTTTTPSTTPLPVHLVSNTTTNLDLNSENSIGDGGGEDILSSTTASTIGDIIINTTTTTSDITFNSSAQLVFTGEITEGTVVTTTIDSLDSLNPPLSNSNSLSSNSTPQRDDLNDSLSITSGTQVTTIAFNSSNDDNNSGNTSIIIIPSETNIVKDINSTSLVTTSESPSTTTTDDPGKEKARHEENQVLGQQVVKNIENLSDEFINCTKINLDLNNGTYISMENGSLYLQEYEKVLHFDEYLVINQNDSVIHLAICSTWLQSAASDASSNDQSSLSGENVWSLELFVRKLQSSLTVIGLTVSVICLLLHLMAFSILPEMRNLSGKNLSSLAIYLLVGYTCFLTRQLAPIWLYDSPITCKVLAITMYYTFISSFIWSAILSFDVWRSLNLASTELRLNTGSQNVRFTIYTIVSLFISLTVTLIVVTKSLSPSTLPMLPSVSFNPPVCWFSSSASLISYFIIPVTLILICNCCFFASISLLLTSAAKVTNATFSKSKPLKKSSTSTSSTASATASSSSATHSIQNDSKLYLKLSILMGLTWILGLIGTLLPNAFIWLLFILLNTTQGLFIFCSFTLTEKVKRGLNERFTKSSIVKSLGHRLTGHGHSSTASNLSTSNGPRH